jgi:1-pyrroline-5-carboxylate dehydrogenase
MHTFKNEPLTDFSLPANHDAIRQALKSVGSQLGRTYKLGIGDREYDSTHHYHSLDPCQHSRLVGVISQGNREHAEQAIAAAWEAFASWGKLPSGQRAMHLLKLAAIMRRRKAELTAWLIFEVGKNWVEADADVAEAIDFCEYYARGAMELAQGGKVATSPGEHNQLIYLPLGVGIVISPWNFPLAILLGTVMSAVVMGNTVIMKPANSGATIAAKAFELVREADFPAGVINYLPCSGSDVGEYLVRHPSTRFINFTGSKVVGLRVHEQASQTPPEQLWIKRVIAEMGGKDCIIVDETTDLDEAARGIVKSAFGFQGQKCSACSRVIVLERVYDDMTQRIKDLTEALSMGPAEDNHQVTAVIDKKAYDSISKYIKSCTSCTLVTGGKGDDKTGFYIEPTVFADIDPCSPMAQEEIFGPVLAVIKAKDFAEALEIGNNTEYGLTASVYSNDRRRLDWASRELHVGNLYLNRACTGALVGVHPFGGFNMSGTNSKAGGPDYLPLFVQAKTITEKL